MLFVKSAPLPLFSLLLVWQIFFMHFKLFRVFESKSQAFILYLLNWIVFSNICF